MYSLLPYNTFGIDVSTARLLEYFSVEELKKLTMQGAIAVPFLHIGGGSSLLFIKDCGRLILHSCVEGIRVMEEDEHSVSVRVGAGVIWDGFVAYCAEHGWYGTENLSLVSGGVGASAVQNIGAYGVEVKGLVTAVEAVDIRAEERVYSVGERRYTYHNSIFEHSENKPAFVTYVHFRLSKKEHYMLDYRTIRQELEKYPALTLSVVRRVIIDIRENKLPDPEVMGNTGSFFMNPIVPEEKLGTLQQEYPRIPYYELADDRVKIPVGWMIGQCGWKDKALGPAAVRDEQALVLVSLGGAKGSDVLALSDAVRASVHEKFGIDIYPEVNLIN